MSQPNYGETRHASVSPTDPGSQPPADQQATTTFREAVTGATDPAAPAVPGYVIEGVLGRGGMVIVYKARHLALKRTVALKMILAGGYASAGEVARFLTEAEAGARLQHPNILQVYEFGEAGGLPFC